MSKPILDQMIEDIDDVISKYRETLSVTYCDVIGALEIIKLDAYTEALKGEKGEEGDF